MKKLLLLALTTMMMAGCIENYEEKKLNSEYSIRVIDSCEYILVNRVGIKAHKGNCKYCAERRNQELKELIEQLKDN